MFNRRIHRIDLSQKFRSEITLSSLKRFKVFVGRGLFLVRTDWVYYLENTFSVLCLPLSLPYYFTFTGKGVIIFHPVSERYDHLIRHLYPLYFYLQLNSRCRGVPRLRGLHPNSFFRSIQSLSDSWCHDHRDSLPVKSPVDDSVFSMSLSLVLTVSLPGALSEFGRRSRNSWDTRMCLRGTRSPTRPCHCDPPDIKHGRSVVPLV